MSTYTARASTGIDTSEFPSFPSGDRGEWLPHTHRILWLASWSLAAVAGVVGLIAYGFSTGQDRLMVLHAAMALAILSGTAALVAVAVRAVRTMIWHATIRGAGQVLDQEIRLVSPVWSARLAESEQERNRLIKEHTGFARAVLDQLGRIETALPERLAERLEAAEREVAEQQPIREVLSGITGWAMSVDGRLAELQGSQQGDGVPTQPNGHHDDSGELSEGIRGYLLGFYDREKGPD